MNINFDLYRDFRPKTSNNFPAHSILYNANNFRSHQPVKYHEANEKKKHHARPIVLATSLIGTVLPMVLIAVHQKKFVKGNGIKNLLGILKVEYDKKGIILLGGSAIAGGLAGGIITDKGKGTWKKVKEANYQFLSNILAPVLFCDLYRNLFEKLKNHKPNLKNLAGKSTFNKFLFTSLISVAGIVTGIPTGAALANKLNRIINKEDKEKRKVQAKDLLIHTDDMIAGLTVTHALDAVPVVKHIDKMLPFVYLLTGLETGNKK